MIVRAPNLQLRDRKRIQDADKLITKSRILQRGQTTTFSEQIVTPSFISKAINSSTLCEVVEVYPDVVFFKSQLDHLGIPAFSIDLNQPRALNHLLRFLPFDFSIY